MAIDGNAAAPFIFLLIFNVAQFAIRYFLMNWSYKLGTDAIGLLTQNAKEFTRAASILGIFIVGSLTCVYGATTLDVKIPNGTTSVAVPVTTVVSKEEIPSYDEMLYKKDSKGNLTEELQENAAVTELDNGKYEITFNKNETQDVMIDIQEILDGVMPQLIPLGLTLLLYFFLSKRGWTPLKCIGLILIIALVGSGFGLFPSIWPSA